MGRPVPLPQSPPAGFKAPPRTRRWSLRTVWVIRMKVLARIPELPCSPSHDGGALRDHASVPVTMPASPSLPHAARSTQPRSSTPSILALAMIAAAIWSVVAWRERRPHGDGRAAVHVATQVETVAPTGEHVR